MALKRSTRFAQLVNFRSALLLGAATSAAFCIAAMAAPGSSKAPASLPAAQPSETMIAAMISPRSAPASSAPELLQNARAATPARPATPSKHAAARTKQVWMTVTAYCPCAKCCGEDANGVTASGRPVSYNHGRFVAADTDVLPFGTKISIPGYHDGQSVPVIDRGSGIRGRHIDVYFGSHATAKEWGTQRLQVTVESDE